MITDLEEFIIWRRDQVAISGVMWQIPMFLDMVEGVLALHAKETKRLGMYDVDVCRSCQSAYPCDTVSLMAQEYDEWTKDED